MATRTHHISIVSMEAPFFISLLQSDVLNFSKRKFDKNLSIDSDEDNVFLGVWLLHYVNSFADSRMKLRRYRRMEQKIFFYCHVTSVECTKKEDLIRRAFTYSQIVQMEQPTTCI